ncbi:putative ATPase [Caldisphaera lagunensis DSM 15908]|uniref:Putative ATPase n=1 Tax=Caldisphaera lagunensis (strain DSM 15908 / JCM 11604 / ANMR 0165 / IC-154) TaxID=1056495 RepID=L0A977_CALLD|nr:ATP-binding protein [Caldisphaera lagunensis]AFZ69979.1 putative ATPase [Caldisphaera lagunensis DSM 15908]
MNENEIIEKAKERAKKYGEVVGLVSRVSPISHGTENKEIKADIPFDVYLNKKFLVGTYIGISIPISETLILGRIKSVERSDILAISKIPALSPMEDFSAITTPLSLTIELLSEKVGNDIVPPSSPIDPQSPIFIPNQEFLREMLGLLDDGIEIGSLMEGYKKIDVPVKLTYEMLRHHILIVGTTGAGKTNLLKIIMANSKIPLIVFDIQGDYVKSMAEIGGYILLPITRDYNKKVNELINIFLFRSGLNDYRIKEKIDDTHFILSNGEKEFHLIISGFRLANTYYLLPDVTPIFSQQGAQFFKLITQNCKTDIDSWEKECKKFLNSYNLHESTEKNILRSVISLENTGLLDIKLEGKLYLDEPKYSELINKKTVVDLRFALERGTLSSTTTAFIIAERIFNIIDNNYKTDGKETPFIFIFDEAHEYFPQGGREEESKEALERLINKIMRLGRVRGIGTILATHRPTDLNDLILTLSNSKIALRADEDALRKIGMEEYSKSLMASPPGYGILRTFSLKVQDLVFRSNKF